MYNKYIKILLVLVLLFLTGCTNSNNNPKLNDDKLNAHKIKSVKVINTPTKVIKKPIIKNKASLTVKTIKDARIRIVNIKPKYKHGILLNKGKYHIEVSKPGYIKQKKWITLNDDRILNVKLEKSIKIIPKVKSEDKINGNIVWNYKRYNDPYFYKVMNFNNYIWSNEKKINGHGEASWIKAKNYCKKLRINFKGTILKGFWLPNEEDLKNLFEYKKYSIFADKKSDIKDMGAVWIDVTTTLESGYLMAKMFYLKNGQYSDWHFSNKKRRSHPAYSNVICVKKEKFDLSYAGAIDLKKSENKSIYMIANEILASKIKHLNNPILKPIPKKSKYLTLKKSEFENIKQYNKRIKKYRKNIDKKYKIALERWKMTNLKITSSSKNLVKEFQKNKKKEYLKALKQAIVIKYGKPYVTSVEYNSDKEIMSMVLKSNRGEYAENVQVPVKLKYAKKFKDMLLIKWFTPIVEYNVIDNKIHFSGIAQIKDYELAVKKVKGKSNNGK